MAAKLNRNDPCHCGSGKKYKNCCLNKDESSLKSKIGIIGLLAVVILGLWFIGNALSGSSGSAPDCPTGQVWSEAHQHCH